VPIYEYRCTKCGHRFEAIQKVSEPPLSKCEKCKGRAERLISSPAIQFKGSGWYITDYARKGSSEPSGASDKSESSSSTDGGSETASATKKKKKEKEKAGTAK
jgi:putative FmdB family regulatory protein